MNILAEMYTLYKFYSPLEKKSEVIEKGLKDLVLRVNRYRRDREKFKRKASEAMSELEEILERFYYHEKSFSTLVHAKTRAYLQNLIDTRR